MANQKFTGNTSPRVDDKGDGTHVPLFETDDASLSNGTREYNLAAATRTAVGSTSSAAVAIGTLSTSREVMLIASTRCMIKFGNSGVAAAAVNDADVLALPADAMFHMRIPAGVTHFRVIRDTADGFLRCIPVA